MPVVTGSVTLHDDDIVVPGTLYGTYESPTGDGTASGPGSIVRAGSVKSNTGSTLTLDLDTTGYWLFRFESTDLDASGQRVSFGPWRYNVTTDVTIKTIRDAQPIGPPITESDVEAAKAARDEAVAAAASVQREQANGVAGLTSSGKLFETRIPDRLSDTALKSTLVPRVVAPPVAPPTGFAFRQLALPTVRRLGNRRFHVEIDLQALRPAANVTYYVATAALGTGDGLTAANACTIPTALAKSDVGTIVLAPGEYDRNTHAVSGAITKSINWLASSPGVRVTGWNSVGSQTWTLQSGSIYTTNRSGTTHVVDVTNRSAWGDYTHYIKRPDLASIVGPGEYAVVGNNVYVWCIGNTDLSIGANRFQIRLGIANIITGVYAGAGTHYVRGIDFEGCTIGGLAALGTATVVAEDCTVKYSFGDGVTAAGGNGIVTRRVTASSNLADGFSYASSGSQHPDAVELYVSSHHNGVHDASVNTHNASTSHLQSRVLRVGGDYRDTKGPVVAEVNSARSWNLGCTFGDSLATAVNQDQSVRADGTGFESDPATMWLDECVTQLAANGFKVTGGGVIHLAGTRWDNPSAFDATGSGVIDFYVPA